MDYFINRFGRLTDPDHNFEIDQGEYQIELHNEVLNFITNANRFFEHTQVASIDELIEIYPWMTDAIIRLYS